MELLTRSQQVAEVKLLGLAPLLLNRFRALIAEFRDRNKKLQLWLLRGDIAFGILSTIAIYLVFTRVIFQILAGQLTLGDVALFGGVAARLRPTLQNSITAIGKMRMVTLHIANLRGFFNVNPKTAITTGMLTPSSSQGEIELRHVYFTYPGSQQPALSDISLHIRPGENVALIGENGAGKSTLVKLIARLYEPDKGEILFDQIDIQQLSLDNLYQRIALVFQDFALYEATVFENIAFGNWEFFLKHPEEIESIARKSGIHDMITTLPKGYDTRLGRRFGQVNLSKGQWQQIAITRALARNASLLILDEPTASLDVRTEYQLFSKFENLTKEKTTILISHRFSTVKMADRILVMDKGRIVERGTHDELVAKAGLYNELYNLHQRQMADSK